MAYFLGLFGGHGPNPSAALLKDNELIAFGEEERFTRIKNAPNALPIQSILYCLNYAGIDAASISSVGFAWDCERYVAEQPAFLDQIKANHPEVDQTFNSLHETELLTAFDPTMIREKLKYALAKHGHHFNVANLTFLNHHECHAASAFYASNFDHALVFTIDGSGEDECTVVWKATNKRLEKLRSIKLPHTLGGYYGSFTEFLGFKSDSEEGKLMGLAPYGSFNQDLQDRFSHFLSFDPKTGNYEIDATYRFYGQRSYNAKFTDKLVIFSARPECQIRDHPTSQRRVLMFSGGSRRLLKPLFVMRLTFMPLAMFAWRVALP